MSAQPIVTTDDIDEAIWWVMMTAPRKIDYRKIIDALLDQRNAITRGEGVRCPASEATDGASCSPKS